MQILKTLTLMIPLYLASCGSQEEVTIKDYRLFLKSTDTRLHREFRSLTDNFNDRTGFTAIRYVNSEEEANSFIEITEGLQAREGKVGWGQWIRETKQERKANLVNGPRMVHTYTMNLEFDKEYLYRRLADDLETRREQSFVLFSHEVGHGLTMDHDEGNPRSVMYPDVGGTKDLENFFFDVRRFFAQ